MFSLVSYNLDETTEKFRQLRVPFRSLTTVETLTEASFLNGDISEEEKNKVLLWLEEQKSLSN